MEKRINRRFLLYAEWEGEIYLIPTITIQSSKCHFRVQFRFLKGFFEVYYWKNYLLDKKYLEE